MYDGSAGFDLLDAIYVGRALGEAGFLWYEEPMREFNIGAYQRLREKVDIPLLSGETSDGAHFNIADFIEMKAADLVRVSTHYKGGVTGALRIAHLAQSFNMRAEVHGGGAANLHIACAIPNRPITSRWCARTRSRWRLASARTAASRRPTCRASAGTRWCSSAHITRHRLSNHHVRGAGREMNPAWLSRAAAWFRRSACFRWGALLVVPADRTVTRTPFWPSGVT